MVDYNKLVVLRIGATEILDQTLSNNKLEGICCSAVLLTITSVVCRLELLNNDQKEVHGLSLNISVF